MTFFAKFYANIQPQKSNPISLPDGLHEELVTDDPYKKLIPAVGATEKSKVETGTPRSILHLTQNLEPAQKTDQTLLGVKPISVVTNVEKVKTQGDVDQQVVEIQSNF